MEIDIASFGRAVLYLGIPFVLLVFYFQWKWARDCTKFIRVLVAEKAGSGRFFMAPKGGDTINISRPDGTTRDWPVNELATIDVTYPGVGFVPSWMQKTIRLAIVNEGDMEPMLNRSPHRERIASPDVVRFMALVADKTVDETVKAEITRVMETLTTGPTRELIADPAVIGALRKSSALKALATIGDDLLDTLKTINAKLGRIMGPHPTIVYIGLGLSVVLSAVLIYLVFNLGNTDLGKLAEMSNDIADIKSALGVK